MQNKSPYEALYFQRLNALDSALRNVVLSVQSEYYTRQSLKLLVHDARLKLKAMDFWLRYLEPVAYKKLNGPLPVEWETEVFEKFEKPYRWEGAGLTLAELYLDKTHFSADRLQKPIEPSIQILDVYRAVSIDSQLKNPDRFFMPIGYFC